MPLTETKQSLDYSLAAIVRIPGRLAEKLTSSRYQASIGAMVVAFLAATQSGLEGAALIGATLAPIVGGGIYTVARTSSDKKNVVTNTIPQVEPQKPPEQAHVKPEDAPNDKQYALMFDPRTIYKDPNPFVAWESFQNYLVYGWLNLHDYAPQVRVKLANAMVNEAAMRLDEAWEHVLRKAGWKEEIPVVYAEILMGYKPKAEFEAMLREGIPGCTYLNHDIDAVLKGYAEVYAIQDTLEQIGDAEVDWTKVADVGDFGSRGIEVLKAN